MTAGEWDLIDSGQVAPCVMFQKLFSVKVTPFRLIVAPAFWLFPSLSVPLRVYLSI